MVRSSKEAEFRAITRGICELLWLKTILDDLKIKWEGTMKLYCDNKMVTNIANNVIQQDQTKHVEIDRHFIKEKLDNGLICTSYISIERQLVDIFTKELSSQIFQMITSKLGIENIYSPT